MVKISVIIPVYNSVNFIDKCLMSLLNQTFKDMEIIVVDDGSNDGSTEKIAKYAEKFSRIVPIYQDNNGISAARNAGLDKASGEYISFIDSDDYVEKNMYEVFYDYMKKNKLDLAVCDYYKEYTDGEKVIEHLEDFPITNIFINPKLIFTINMGPCNKLFKRSLFDGIRFPKIKYEDFAIIPEILLRAKKIGKINKPLNYYFIRGNGETGVVDARVFDIITNMKKINSLFKKYDFYDKNYSEVEYFNASKLLLYIIQQRTNKDAIVANKFIKEAYEYLDCNFPNWKKNKYFSNENKAKLFIYKHEKIAKFYCTLYRKFIGDKNEKIR